LDLGDKRITIGINQAWVRQQHPAVDHAGRNYVARDKGLNRVWIDAGELR
jgi:hypothetical protein